MNIKIMKVTVNTKIKSLIITIIFRDSLEKKIFFAQNVLINFGNEITKKLGI